MKKIYQQIKKKIYQPPVQSLNLKIPKAEDIIKKVKTIEIAARSKLNVSYTGSYRTIFRGRGLEFDRVREYQEKDEIRSIDWNVTARTGKLYVKNYTEERELNIYFFIDASASSLFHFQGKSQKEVAAEICCSLGFSALHNTDKVGLLLFTDRIEKFLKAKKGKNYILQIIQEVLKTSFTTRHTNIVSALEKVENIMRTKSVIFFISDFLDNSEYSKILQKIHSKHEIILIDLHLSLQKFLNEKITLDVQDMETGMLQTIYPDSKNWTNQHLQRKELQNFLKKNNPLYFPIKNYQNPILELASYLSPKSSIRKIGQSKKKIVL